MTKPKSVKVGAHQYSVSYHVTNEELSGYYAGKVDYHKATITIEESRVPSKVAETFLHEVVHAIAEERNLDLEEREVDQVAAGMAAAFRDNPKVFGKTFFESFE